MVRTSKKVFEAEVRDTQSHASTDDPSADAQFTVNTDTLHPTTFTSYDKITVYVDDTHDNTFDTVVQTTAEDDTDFSAVINEGTATSGANSKFEITGPVGRVRLSFQAGALTTAPTTGRCRVTIHCFGRE